MLILIKCGDIWIPLQGRFLLDFPSFRNLRGKSLFTTKSTKKVFLTSSLRHLGVFDCLGCWLFYQMDCGSCAASGNLQKSRKIVFRCCHCQLRWMNENKNKWKGNFLLAGKIDKSRTGKKIVHADTHSLHGITECRFFGFLRIQFTICYHKIVLKWDCWAGD